MIDGLKSIILVISTVISMSYSGNGAHYAPGVMERVARVRKMPQIACVFNLPGGGCLQESSCKIATYVSPRRQDIGRWVKVTALAKKTKGRQLYCRITDVGHPKDLPNLKRRKLIEFDFNSAKYLCGIKRVNEAPPTACPVHVEEIKEFKITYEQVIDTPMPSPQPEPTPTPPSDIDFSKLLEKVE